MLLVMGTWYWNTGWIPSVAAVVGNSLVIYVVTTRRKLRTTTNRFVLSLAVADLSVGACYYPGHVICQALRASCHFKIRDDIAIMAIFSSVTNLCAMTLDRYIAIVKPLFYMSLMTARRATILAAAAWLIPLCVVFIPSLCASLQLFRLKMEVSVVIWTTLFEFFPSAFLLLTSARAVITARRHCHHDTRLQNQLRFNHPTLKLTRTTSSAKLIGTVVAFFLVCYAVEVYSSICYFTALCPSSVEVQYVVRFLVIANSAANPILYTLFKRDIKNELSYMFRKKGRKVVRDRGILTTRV